MSPEQRDNEKRRFTGDRSSSAWGGAIGWPGAKPWCSSAAFVQAARL